MTPKKIAFCMALIFPLFWSHPTFAHASKVAYQQEIVGFKKIWDRAFSETVPFVLPAGWTNVPGSLAKIYISKNRLKISTLRGHLKLHFVRAWLDKASDLPMGVEPYAWLYVQLDIEYNAITRKSYKCDVRTNNLPFGTAEDPHHFYVCIPRTILFATSITINSGPVSYKWIEKQFVSDAKDGSFESPSIDFYSTKIKKSFPVWEIEDYDDRLGLLLATGIEYCSECNVK